MTAVLTTRNPAAAELNWFLRASRAPRLRTIGEFFQEEMIIPTGPFEGRRARFDRQPFTRLWCQEVQCGRWLHTNTTGCGQGGKSFMGLATPVLYHLFEIGETVILGIPDMDMADDKYKRDLLPVISRTRYREFLPRRGEGSEGGKVKNMIVFGNGAMLKFMSAGGDDKSRAAFTSRVVVMTETEGFRLAGESSEETSKMNQIFARTRAFGNRKRIYTECTVGAEDGPTWHFHQTGTASRIVSPCPHCKEWVAPERVDFRGWEGAADELTAMEQGRFHCPACGEAIADDQRRDMNEAAILLHRGQALEAGKVVGPLPRTTTFSFRFSAFNNLLMSSSDIAQEMYQGANDPAHEQAERKLCQFLWCEPFKPPISEEIILEVKQLLVRQGRCGQGFVPHWCEVLTVGADLRKRQLHWTAIAWRQGFAGQVIDRGIITVRGDELPLDDAIKQALLELRDLADSGWVCESGHERDGELRIADAVFYDSRYAQAGCFAFTRDPKTDRVRYLPIEGVGSGDYHSRMHYQRPTKKTKGNILKIGDGWHLKRYPEARVNVIEIDANFWKTELQSRLAVQAYDQAGLQQQDGSLVLFETKNPTEHLDYCRHLTSERQQIVFTPGKGEEKVWVRSGQANHYLDATSYATCAAHVCGIRTAGLAVAPVHAPRDDEGPAMLITPSGQPFFVGDRD